MNRPIILFIALFSILASGCVKNGPKLDLSDNGVKSSLVGQLKENLYKKEWIEYNCADSGYYNSGISGDAFTQFDCDGVPTKSPGDAIRIRTQVVDNGLGIIDSAYGIYIRDVRKRRTVGEFLADLTEIGASTSIGITKGGTRALQVIGVALTGFRAGRKSAELNFFDEKTTNVLIKRMDASRSQVLGEIRQKQSRPTTEYTFDAALDDLIRYFDAGTLNRAFTELDKQASLDAEVARLGVLKIQGLEAISKIPTEEQRQQVFDIHRKLSTLEDDLDSQDQSVRDKARDFLKSVFEKASKRAEFKDIVTNIQSSFETDDTLTDDTKALLRSAFDKLAQEEPLTGHEYLALINTLVNKAETDELQKLLLSIFNEK